MANHPDCSCSISAADVGRFEADGFLVVDDLLGPNEVEQYCVLYDRFIRGEIPCDRMRSDLGGHAGKLQRGTENITQIMWPSDFVEGLIIDTAPMTNTPTPWRQDAAYWIDVPDRRAVSAWVALDEATVDNVPCGLCPVSPNPKLIEAVSTGWPRVLSSLKSLLETGESLVETRRWPEGM
jgi:hypothetical protein